MTLWHDSESDPDARERKILKALRARPRGIGDVASLLGVHMATPGSKTGQRSAEGKRLIRDIMRLARQGEVEHTPGDGPGRKGEWKLTGQGEKSAEWIVEREADAKDAVPGSGEGS